MTEGRLTIGWGLENDVAPKDRGAARLFQDDALRPHRSMRQNMEFGLRPPELAQSEMDRRVWEAMTK